MDPLALTTSIIEIGLKVKDSIDTFAKRRSHAKELASDALVDLRHIAEFYEKNQSMLSHETLGPLHNSLDLLKSDLYRVHERCQVYEPKQDIPRIKRLTLPLRLWMDSDEIEADLIQIKERIQTSMNRISLLSGARVEVRVTKIEGLLANSYESRDPIQHFDSVFTQELHGDPGLATFNHSSSELDNADVQYIRMKALKFLDTISIATITTVGTKTFNRPIYTGTTLRPLLHNIIFTTGRSHARGDSSENISIEDLCRNTLYLVHMLSYLEAEEIIEKILGTVESRLRRTLGLGTLRLQLPYHIKGEEEGAYDFLELILQIQNYFTFCRLCGNFPARSICDEDINRALEAIQFSRSRLEQRAFPSNYHRMRFLRGLMPLIGYHAIAGQVEECYRYCSEALEVIQACGLSNVHNIIEAGPLQTQVGVLRYLSQAHERACDYTSAYHTGMECITSIESLSNIDKSLLPDDFEFFPHVMGYMQQAMPAWTSIVRNPEHRTSYTEDCVDVDNDGGGSARQIEWGIAL